MSVFLEKGDSEKSNCDPRSAKRDGELVAYYRAFMPGCVPIPLYKNTKYMTVDHVNSGLLTEEERVQYAEENYPTGYRFDLRGSGYLVVDVDMDEAFRYKASVDWKAEAELLGGPDSIPDKMELTENMPGRKKRKIATTGKAAILFSNLFRTPYVQTPSGGFHFYFKNDLTQEQLIRIFGAIHYRYIKVIELFDIIDIDIFVDVSSNTEERSDAFLVLPFSKILKENSNRIDIEASKLVPANYSGVRYPKVGDCSVDTFRAASELVPWLTARVTRSSIPRKAFKEENRYLERGRAIAVSEIEKPKFIDQFSKDMAILASRIREVKTYSSNPFSLYQLMSFVAFFPVDMHADLLSALFDNLLSKFSKNARTQALVYYRHLASDPEREKDLKNPRYMEAVINSNYGTTIDNRWNFVYANEEHANADDEEEIIDDDNNDPIGSTVAMMASKYGLECPR